MSRYYTNVFRAGNKLLVREVKDGVRRKFKVEYKPTLYIPTTKPGAKFHTPEGVSVEAIQPGTMRDCYEFTKKYADVENFKFYGNTTYEYAFLAEEYPGAIEYNIDDLVKLNFDIETARRKDNGQYSEASEALGEITSITLKSSKDNIFHVFACKTLKSCPSHVKYHHCDDEKDLLDRFLNVWGKIEPDIICGYNCILYDVPYVVNRIQRILSEEDVKRLSPWGIVKQTTLNLFNKEHLAYDIAGSSILDYLILYKKNVVEPRESYKLDYISEVELKKNKVDYGEHSGLDELYEKDFDKFVLYNCTDVALVDELEAKLKLIELQVMVAYDAGVNYDDVRSQVRVWDTKICNHLLKNNVVVPQRPTNITETQFPGGFNFQPKPGMYEWIVSEDVAGLYPSNITSCNIGIETFVEYKHLPRVLQKHQDSIKGKLLKYDPLSSTEVVDFEFIKQAISDEVISTLREHNLAMAINGAVYKKDKQSFFSEMIVELAQRRKEYKAKYADAEKKIIEVKAEIAATTYPNIDLLSRRDYLQSDIDNFGLKQKLVKVNQNSLYGILGNKFFRHFSIINSAAITTTGQFIIQFVGNELESFLNKKIGLTGYSFRKASATDSIYFTLKPFVDKYIPNGTIDKKVDFIDQICKQVIQPEINRLFDVIITRYLNGFPGYLSMNREVIGDKAIWTAKARYIINVRDDEGKRKFGEKSDKDSKLKVVGLEIRKATVPKFCRDAMSAAVEIIMNKDEPTLHDFIVKTKKEFLALPIETVSIPRGVNGMLKYGNKDTIFIYGSPGHTRACLTYNHWLDKLKLNGKYTPIRDGDKIKYCFLKEPNPIMTSKIGFFNTLPKEFGVHEHIDWEMQWQKTFVEPLMLILKPIGWHMQQMASLDDLFGVN